MNRQRALERLRRSKPELQARFGVSELTYDAALRNLDRIGETATHRPDEVRSAHPQNPLIA